MRASARQVESIRHVPDAPVIVLSRGRRSSDESLQTAKLDRVWLDLQHSLTSAMNNGAFQVVGGSGHYIHLDRPERVADAIHALVEALRIGSDPVPH